MGGNFIFQNMVQPGALKSIIHESETLLRIHTPARKRVLLIVLISIYALVLGIGIMLIIANTSEIPIGLLLLLVLLFGTILFFLLKYLFWQLKGFSVITVDQNTLTVLKKSPLFNKTKVFDLNYIGSFVIRDNSVSNGPLGMLQLLGIVDKIVLTFEYEYQTVTLISGIDATEAMAVKIAIENKINNELNSRSSQG